jgi:hypothetical protein
MECNATSAGQLLFFVCPAAAAMQQATSLDLDGGPGGPGRLLITVRGPVDELLKCSIVRGGPA